MKAGPGRSYRKKLRRRCGTVRIGKALHSWIVRAGMVSLVAWTSLEFISPRPLIPWTPAMHAAAEGMADGLEVTRAFCRDQEIPVDPALDPNHTCLIGPRYTPLFTSLGQLEAKRTSLNPDVAGLLAFLLQQAGVGVGDTVAVGASASFPGLLLAALAAIRALEAHPVTILSLGASSYGATRPDLTLLDLYGIYRMVGLTDSAPVAVSFGGSRDVGSELDVEVRERLEAAVAEAGVPLLLEGDLPVNVAWRLEAYGNPAVFVNIGGGEANLGTSPKVLGLAPGRVELHPGDSLPPPPQRGVLYSMLEKGIPALHLLNLRGLALRYGLPWDPLPLPDPGTTQLVDPEAHPGWLFWVLTSCYLGLLVLMANPIRAVSRRS